MKWLTLEADSDRADALHAAAMAARGIVVPPHFFSEVANAIRRKVARGLISASEAYLAFHVLDRLIVTIARPADLYREAFDLAERYRLPAIYDSIYVALADLRGCDLWTADLRLF